MKVNLGDLNEMRDDLLKFINEKLNLEGKVVNDEIEINDSDVKTKALKTYLKRFLHANGLKKKHRIFVNNGVFTIETLRDVDDEENT